MRYGTAPPEVITITGMIIGRCKQITGCRMWKFRWQIDVYKSCRSRMMYGQPLSPDAIRTAVSPILKFDKCESSAFVRSAIRHALAKDLAEVSPHAELIPGMDRLKLCAGIGRSSATLEPLQSEEDYKKAAVNAATNLSNARVWLEQANIVSEAVRPTMNYYGALSFFEFITSCLVKPVSGKSAHGLSVSCHSDGSKFDRDWPRNDCYVQVEGSGDFPLLVDVLTAAGWPSLFSKFRLHQETKNAPWEVRNNPAPIFTDKVSLDLVGNFDFAYYVAENPGAAEWLEGGDRKKVASMTALLLNFIIVFVASSLSRYYIPAWRAIVEADKSAIYNNIRAAYRRAVSIGHDDTMLRNQLIEDLDRFLPA